MSVAAKLKECLDSNRVAYDVLTHPQVYTAQDVASAAHVPGKELAKSVVLKADDRYVLAVLPAPLKVDTDRLREELRATEVRIAHEFEFAAMFPGCELGAMPPFGNLYGVDVFVDRSLSCDEEIVFNAGSHVEAIRMKYKDFERLVHPTVGDFVSSK
ncbi:MAG TPA: YbaK/EbsC family protein [Blastocatellia bacterium]|nr:YbaK/EbsC family protein [Blastocatellia bacterium]